jgi:hypothetical protein
VIRALVLITVLGALAPIAEAKRACFSGPMRAQIIALPRAKIAGSGGVIVASGSKLPDWRFRDLNRIVRPHVVKIAPGLAIYHPPPLAGIEIVLENENHGALLRTERALGIEATAAPPRVRSITKSARAVLTDLEDKVPARAIILFASRISGDGLVPLTWVSVVAGQSVGIDLWHSPGSCEHTIEGWLEPKLGDKIVLQWVDAAGRISEPSTPITVAAKP